MLGGACPLGAPGRPLPSSSLREPGSVSASPFTSQLQHESSPPAPCLRAGAAGPVIFLPAAPFDLPGAPPQSVICKRPHQGRASPACSCLGFHSGSILPPAPQAPSLLPPLTSGKTSLPRTMERTGDVFLEKDMDCGEERKGERDL